MKLKYRANLWAGIASILFGITVYILTPLQISLEYGATSGSAGMITSRTLPYALAVLCIGLGGFLMLESLILKKDTVKELDLKKELRTLAYILCFLVYIVLFQHSFILSTAFLGIVTLAFTRNKKILYYVIVLAMVGALYLTFTRILNIRLP